MNASTVRGLMCRNTINVSREGDVFDCDFNQMTTVPWRDARALSLWETDPVEVENREIFDRGS